jgi:hypothetical protein
MASARGVNMTVRTVFKVKNLDTGKYMGKSGRWDNKGKTWETIGQLKLTLGNAGYWSNNPSYSGRNDGKLPGPRVKIIEVQIVESEDNMSDLDDVILRQRRYITMGLKYGESFRNLVERIESQGQNDQFQWVLVCQAGYDWQAKEPTGDIVEMFDLIKSMKLKQNKDYKKSTTYSDSNGAIAFASKSIAMQIRLAMSGRVTSIDIKDYVETNLDEGAEDALNSST